MTAEAFLQRGREAHECGDLEAALAAFTSAIEREPNNALGWYWRGCVHQDQGRLDEAIADFTEANRLDPDDADALAGRATAREAAGAKEEALADLGAALRLRPGDPAMLVQRGNLFSDLGRLEEAITDFREALRKEQDYVAGVRYNLGNALTKLGRTAEALAEYDEAVRADPQLGWAHHGRGHALAELGRHTESLAACDEAIRLLPGNPLPINGRAAALANLDRHEEALGAFAEALRFDPSFTTARANRALLHEKMGRPDLAAADRAALPADSPGAGSQVASDRRSPRPSAKMKRLYHRFSELCGGEPEDLWVFDPLDFVEAPPPFLGLTHVMAWPADKDCDVTSFLSLGMSERRMIGADYFCEVQFAIRAPLTKQQRLEVARRVADTCAYPFQYDRKLDWWEVIRNPGRLPGFEGCQHILLHPRLNPEGFDLVEDPEGIVKVLYLVPITPLERHLIVEHGRQALQEYLAANDIDILKDRFDPPGQVLD
jgi:tetratricopeptide (TPR) repeat protein